MPNFRNLKQIKAFDSSSYFVYCDLQFEIYLGIVI